MVVVFTVTASDVEPSDVYTDVRIQGVITNITTSGGAPALGGLHPEIMTFTVPFDGLYSFHVTSIANGNGASPMVLFRNGEQIMTTARSDKSAVGAYPLGTNHVILGLVRGDLVSLKTRPHNSFFSSFLGFYSPSDVTFTGQLVYAPAQ